MALENLKRLNIRLTPEMHELVSDAAQKRGITMNALVVFAIETYIQQTQVIPILPELMRIYNDMEAKEKEEGASGSQA